MKYPFWILERSFGGIGVAVSPINGTQSGNWPEGPSSPMSLEACRAMMMACSADDAQGPAHMVFLVGGAGNGKSKLAAEVVAQIPGSRRGASSNFAQRCYEFDLPNGGALRVVNDATIPPKDKHEAPLRRDLVDALRNGEHLLACINRGVLIGEVGKAATAGDAALDHVAESITAWLLDGRFQEDEADRVDRLTVENDQDAAHYRFGKITLGGREAAIIHVVYMDRASLLEEWEPAPSAESTVKPLPLGKMRTLALLGIDRKEHASAFENCITELAKTFGGGLDADDLDPVRANAMALSRPGPAKGWCSVMRGAEILTGTHFSYRELWALSAHSFVGPVASDTFAALSEHVRAKIVIAQQGRGEERLSALMTLGALRTHMLLFDAGNAAAAAGDETATSVANMPFPWPHTASDALRAVQFADPLRQFGATDGKDASALGRRLDGISEGQLPGAQLAREEPAIAEYWSPLDATIEEEIGLAIAPRGDSLPLRVRSKLLAWYGRYMYRLVALVRGWPAYVSVAHEWQNAWEDANQGKRLSREIEDAVLDILAPQDDAGRSAYFTFLQPRVTPGAGSAPKVRLELPRNKVEISARTVGDRIDIEIILPSANDQRPAAEATLDFHFLRETMARRDGHGFTDSLLLIEPRIERLRAAMVAAQLAAEDGRNRFYFTDRTFAEAR